MSDINITVEPPKTVNLTVRKTISLPVITVQIPGIQGPRGEQGPAGENKPLEVDPLQTYLKARGEMKWQQH